jgi:hypothetical protein
MNMKILTFMLMFFASILPHFSSASAYNDTEFDSIFDILNYEMAENAWDIFQSQPYHPDKTIQVNGHVSAWVDIVGFKNMTQIDGINYIPGNPADYAVVQYDIQHDISGIEWWNWNVDYLKDDLDISVSNGTVIATLNTDLKYHHSILKCRALPVPRCWISKTYYYETAQFYDSEPSPFLYDCGTGLENLTVFITIYNNSVSPKTYVYVPADDYLTHYSVQYGNDTVTHHLKKGTVEYTDKGMAYVNLTESDSWKIDGNTSAVGRIHDYAVIKTAELNQSMLNISASSAYDTVYLDNFNISVVEYSPDRPFQPIFWLICSILLIFTAGTYLIVRRFAP